jgi:hypothetical protein
MSYPSGFTPILFFSPRTWNLGHKKWVTKKFIFILKNDQADFKVSMIVFYCFEMNLYICNFQFTPDAVLAEPGIGSLKKLHTLVLPASVLTDEVITKMMLPKLTCLRLFKTKVILNLHWFSKKSMSFTHFLILYLFIICHISITKEFKGNQLARIGTKLPAFEWNYRCLEDCQI